MNELFKKVAAEKRRDEVLGRMCGVPRVSNLGTDRWRRWLGGRQATKRKETGDDANCLRRLVAATTATTAADNNGTCADGKWQRMSSQRSGYRASSELTRERERKREKETETVRDRSQSRSHPCT